ncbi:hypothetical protein HCH52_00390 [Oscillospiraceae bacterium HV4-5-C5C]|nr:hypothetical protein [Oscillospiraceae bacterium HV4-5-C5C]
MASDNSSAASSDGALSTSHLQDILKSCEPGDVTAYQNKYLSHDELKFSDYMDTLIRHKGLKRKDIFQRADLPQKYGYALLKGDSHTLERDNLIRIFLAMRLRLDQVQTALRLYNMPILYPRFIRDAILIIAFNRGLNSVDEVNEILLKQQQRPLKRCEDK